MLCHADGDRDSSDCRMEIQLTIEMDKKRMTSNVVGVDDGVLEWCIQKSG